MPSKTRSRKKIDYRILEHELVPEHRKLSFEEAVLVLKRFGVKPNQLPQISINDPVVRLLRARPGDIIEIKRRSPTAGESIYYRIVAAF
ncbi:MAG: DNA-directed RNA polymerase subunit H [Desulfurococcales archaeon]|nr:DNA-directed RNA polymerase subunit H [Desulfurococcales archaeon]